MKELRNTKFHALTLTLVILVAIFSLPPTFSLLMRNVTIRSSGTIRFIRPLHVEGKYIKNDLGQIVFLRGLNKHGFEDDPSGHWQLPDGSIAFNTFDPVVVVANLDAMKSWGINFLRMYSTAEFWINNTGNHRRTVKDLATMAAEREIYLMYSFWHVRAPSGAPALPYPPYSETGDEAIIGSEADFVEVWRSIATELKNYPNVIFELWNEPHGNETARESWFNVVQQCINAIREAGATNLIVVQWGYGIWANLSYGGGGFMDWVEDYPLNDLLGNIVYSTHLYRGEIHYTEPTRINCWEYDDLKRGLQQGLVDYVLNTLNKPVIMGEIGPNMWQTGDELTRELAFYNNSLTIFNEWEMGYAGFWWWPSGTYAHLVTGPNYQANVAGEILKIALSG